MGIRANPYKRAIVHTKALLAKETKRGIYNEAEKRYLHFKGT